MNQDLADTCLRYLDGDLTVEELQAFDRLLVDSEQVADLLSQLAMDEQHYRATPAEQAETPLPPIQLDASALNKQKYISALAYVLQHTFTPKRLTIGAVSAAAALILLALILFVPFGSQPNQPELATPSHEFDSQQEAVSSDAPVVAQVHSTINARWIGLAPGQTQLRSATPLTLSEGLAELELTDGARVIVQAPAVFEVIDGNAMRLTSGRLVAHVPPSASGFEVTTRNARIVDIGTEFGVLAEPNGGMHAHVFKGSVVLTQNTPGVYSRPTTLVAGEAIEINEDGAANAVNADGLAFVRPDAYTKLREMPPVYKGLIAYYAFDRPNEGVLRESRGQAMFDAEIVGARWVEGRTPGKHALDFAGLGADEHVTLSKDASERLALKGAYTIALWINIHSLPADKHWRAIVTKGNDSWRVLINEDERQMGFYQSLDAEFGEPEWDGLFTNKFELNRWYHLVVTGQPDGDTVVTRLYLDGELQGEKNLSPMLDSEWPVAIGSNAEAPDEFLFDGRFGEIGFFDRALVEDEVRQLQDAGAPLDLGP